MAHTTGKWRIVEDLLQNMAERPGSSYLFPHDSMPETAKLLLRLYPDYVLKVLAAADAACRNEFLLIGHDIQYPNGINWNSDPVTGYRWPLLHWKRYGRHLQSMPQSDLIHIWELNRHQYFITLGIAYWLTNSKKYLEAFCSQIQSWIESNPVQLGVNWYSPLEVAIRLMAWTAAFQFFRCSSEFREKIGKIFLKSLWQQANYLHRNLQNVRSESNVPNNHLLGELCGLALVGSAFPEFRAATEWRSKGLNLLRTQVVAQTHLDGVNKEQATGYHRFVSELLLILVARSRQGALPDMPELEDVLERMLNFMLFLVTPDGAAPAWGDSASGRVLGLGLNRDFWDFRPILSAGAVLFGRQDWKYVADQFDVESFILLGSTGLDLWQHIEAHPPDQASRAFPYGGMYILRDSWAVNTDVAFFRCGPFGLGGERNCAHAHCDLLSFALWVSGRPLLADSGTYVYRGPWRDRFRLTSAHNSVVIDGRDQSIPMVSFNWRQIPETKCIGWDGSSVKGLLDHPDQVEFIRELSHKNPGVWDVIDKFTGQNEHVLEWFFHFHPGVEVQIKVKERLLVAFREDKPFLTLSIPGKEVCCQLNEGWYSAIYGIKERNKVLVARWQGELCSEGNTFDWQFKIIS